jgi:alanine dehydrogenase
MIIGVPKEVKDHEARVGLVPSGVEPLGKRPVKATLKDQATWSLARRSYRK